MSELIKQQNNTPKISVIVPVYNVEKYIHQCIDSILGQTFTDFELLLIDDGSPDNCGAICDEYAAKDSRIRVFHQENAGVSAARQFGIDNAIGEYSIHVDSDDFIEPLALELLYTKAKEDNFDIVICDYFSYDKSNCKYISQQASVDNYKCLELLLMNKLIGTTWNKLIRHRLYKEYSINFDIEICYCEDYLVIVDLLLLSVKIGYLSKAIYFYRNTPNSITRSFSKANYNNQIAFIDKLVYKLKDIQFVGRYLSSLRFDLVLFYYNRGLLNIKEVIYQLEIIRPDLKIILENKNGLHKIQVNCMNHFRLIPIITSKCFYLIWKSKIIMMSQINKLYDLI